MCGIFGHTGFQPDQLQISREALNTLIHRGPDQWGEWYDQNVYIGHHRLSIIDLSENARQPMHDENESVFIAVNGEIYNFKDLKKELAQKYKFKSQSDSEVILHGYMHWGIDGLLERIDGMYAFIVYDKRINSLFIVRDRVGIKPLYYGVINGKIIWASELKAIVKFIGKGKLTVDKTAFYDFLTYKYIPTPKTMYRHVYKLEPAHYLKIDLNSNKNRQENKIEKIKYWELDTTCQKRSLSDAVEGVRYYLGKSVKEQMISDVPLGFFLSGGIDSSVLVSIASEFSKDIDTYTIGFNEKKYDERHYARLAAAKFNTKHSEKIIDVEIVNNLFNHLKVWYDEPFGDTSAFPTYLVSSFAKEASTVVLTGDGGDEVFGGYLRFLRFPRVMKHHVKLLEYFSPVTQWASKNIKINILKKISKKIERDFLLNELELYTKYINGLIATEKKKYRKLFHVLDDYDDYWYFRKYYRPELPARTRLQYLDFHTYLPDEMLTKVDRVSMAVSLEARVPFLSREVIAFSFSLDEALRYYSWELKGLLKYAYKDILPREIFTRDKRGFSIPINKWKKNLVGEQTFFLGGILEELFKPELSDFCG